MVLVAILAVVGLLVQAAYGLWWRCMVRSRLTDLETQVRKLTGGCWP